MSLNIDLKVLSANGFYDFVTPFYQTVMDLQKMSLIDAAVRQNLSATFYPSGHMVYLAWRLSRTALKRSVRARMRALRHAATIQAVARVRDLQARKRAV